MISRILSGWLNTPEWTNYQSHKPITKISVIIAARNEEKNIKKCIESIVSCDYPSHLLQIIVINDASTDDTLREIKSIRSGVVTLLNTEQNEGKKAALELGIRSSTGQLIITTDADCEVQKNWLLSIVSFYKKSKATLIAAPIQYSISKSIIQRFQYIDGINNMAVTANGITKKSYFMANGANLAFEKALFLELNGYDKSKDIASGDDMFMIQSAAAIHPSKVRFLKSKEAVVFTQPERNLADLMTQRKRWATKTKSYSDKRIMKIQGYVFFFIILLIANLLLSPIGSGLSFFGFLFGLFIKLSIDYMYLSQISKYFPSKDALKSFLPASFMFLIYIILAGWWALFPSQYRWKGRDVK